MRAVRGDNHRSTRDFHLSPPKMVNYGEGENRANVNFEGSPLQRAKIHVSGFPVNSTSHYFGLAIRRLYRVLESSVQPNLNFTDVGDYNLRVHEFIH